MDNKNSYTEKLFREGFKEFELPVTDADFAAIEAKMAAKTKKRRGFWLPSIFIAAALGLGTIWFVLSQQKNSEDPNFHQSEEPSKSALMAPNAQEEVQQNSGSVKERSNAPVSSSQTELFGSETKEKLTKKPDASKTGEHLQKGKKAAIVGKLNETKTSSAGLKPFMLRSKGPYKLADEHPNFEMPDLIDLVVKFAKPIVEDADQPSKPTWSAGLLLSAGNSAPHFSANRTDVAQLSYRQFAERSGRYLEHGLSIGAQHKAWAARSGLLWQQLQTQTNAFKIQLYDSIPVLNPQGDTLGFFRLNIRDSTGQGDWNNNYQYLSIPISASRNISINAKNALVLGAGCTFQYLLNAEGTVIGSNLKTEALNKNSLQRSVQQWNVQIGYERVLNKNIRLQLSYIHQQNISSLTRRAEDVQIRMLQNGIRFNISYNILPR